MAVYRCGICDNFIDDDYDPGSEYGDELICENCVTECHEAVDAELGTARYDQMSEEEVLSYHLRNL